MNKNIIKEMKIQSESNQFMSKYYKFRFWWTNNVFYKLPNWATCLYYKWDRFYYEQISTRIRHRNPWALKSIPRTFSDFQSIVPDFFYNFMISYVDDQKCFEQIVIEKEMSDKIKEIYDFAQIGRPILLQQIEDAYPPLDPNWLENWNKEVTHADKKKTYKQKYGQLDKLQKQLWKKDTEYMNWMTKNRDFLWT